MGTLVASAMYSATSTTCVQLASLLSRTPSDAEIESPLAQMALKPASSAMRADRPLCASMMKSSCAGSSRARSCWALDGAESAGMEEFFDGRDERGEVGGRERTDVGDAERVRAGQLARVQRDAARVEKVVEPVEGEARPRRRVEGREQPRVQRPRQQRRKTQPLQARQHHFITGPVARRAH